MPDLTINDFYTERRRSVLRARKCIRESRSWRICGRMDYAADCLRSANIWISDVRMIDRWIRFEIQNHA